MIACTQCGNENRETALFCLSCGGRLQWPEEPLPSEMESLEDAAPDLALDPAGQTETAPVPLVEADNKKNLDEHDAPSEELDNELVTAADDLTALEPKVVKADATDAANESGTEMELEPGETTPAGRPLEAGTQLAGRYEIVALLEETPVTYLYDALDIGRCPQCGFPDSELGDLFCANCGASLEAYDNVPHVHLRALRVEGETIIQLEEETAGEIERWFEADGRLYAVLPLPAAEPDPTLEVQPFGRGVRHIVGYNSDPGLMRELDEDALLVLTLMPMFESNSRPALGLYAVADGMGGHEGGEIASRLAIETLAETITRRLFFHELTGEPVLPDTPPSLLVEAIQAINGAISQLQQKTGSDLGTTLTAALVRDDLALIANVGDSRTYLWRDGHLSQITQDHSLVAQLVEAGAIRPEDVYTHPDKSAIYRSLGHTSSVEVDIFHQPLQPGDRLILCCDGVWEMLRDEGLEEVLLLEPDPQRAADEIVRRSNLAGGEDNISAIVVHFESLGSSADQAMGFMTDARKE